VNEPQRFGAPLFEADLPKYSASEVCALIGWSRVTLWRHLHELPHCRVGRLIRFSDRQIREILASFERHAESEEAA
jgi:hypothetical protein